MKSRLFLAVLIMMAAASANADLVGYWTFDSVSLPVSDLSGFGNNGTLMGGAARSTDAVVGTGSLSLNGTSAYVQLYSCYNFKGSFATGKATLAFWLKLNNANPSGTRIGFANIGCWAYPSYYPSAANTASLRIFLSDGLPVTVTLLPNVAREKWHHFAVTVDTDDAMAGYRVYQNGQLVGTAALDGSHGNFLPPFTPRIGTSYDGAANKWYYLDGKIDDVRIYNESLSMAKIKALYNPFDLSGDKQIAFADLNALAASWLSACSDPTWCDGADLDQSGRVDTLDFAALAKHWREVMP